MPPHDDPGRKQYLGDSVYVKMDEGFIVLTTENGLGPSNTIVLDHDVWNSLLAFHAQWRNAQRRPSSTDVGDG